MKPLLRHFAALTALFVFFFTAQRWLFLAFGHQKLHGIAWKQVGNSFSHGLSTDLSATAHILFLAALLSIPLLFIERPVLRQIMRRYLVAVIVLAALINVVDIGLFAARGTRLDRKTLSYLIEPQEMLLALSDGRTALLLLVATVQCLAFVFLLNKIDASRSYHSGSLPSRIAIAVLLPALCILVARGGPQDHPINKSGALFSRYPVLNEAAQNGVLNLMAIAFGSSALSSDPYVNISTTGISCHAARSITALHDTGHRSFPWSRELFDARYASQ